MLAVNCASIGLGVPAAPTVPGVGGDETPGFVILLEFGNDSRYGLFFGVDGGSDLDCRCSVKGRLVRVSCSM